MVAVMLCRFIRSAATMGVVATASATITVANNIASTTVLGTPYTWPVIQGGAGAAAGQLGLSGNSAIFTYDSVNYTFPISRSGSGSVAIDITSNIAALTINAIHIEWPVSP